MKTDIILSLQTHADLTPWPVGEALLSPLFAAPALRPARIATMEEPSPTRPASPSAAAPSPRSSRPARSSPRPEPPPPPLARAAATA